LYHINLIPTSKWCRNVFHLEDSSPHLIISLAKIYLNNLSEISVWQYKYLPIKFDMKFFPIQRFVCLWSVSFWYRILPLKKWFHFEEFLQEEENIQIVGWDLALYNNVLQYLIKNSWVCVIWWLWFDPFVKKAKKNSILDKEKLMWEFPTSVIYTS
jgi:hypothetical protein